MPTDLIPTFPPPSGPPATTAALRRQVWLFALFLSWGAFELGRWTEAAQPWLFSPAFSGSLGVLMVVASVFGLRSALRKAGGRSDVDAPAR
jgi:hypothetical protein